MISEKSEHVANINQFNLLLLLQTNITRKRNLQSKCYLFCLLYRIMSCSISVGVLDLIHLLLQFTQRNHLAAFQKKKKV